MSEERSVPAYLAVLLALVEDIRRFAKSQNAAIIATITGDANLHFFRELARQRVSADTIPVMSLSINEAELPALMRSNVAGQLVALSAPPFMEHKQNTAFIPTGGRCNPATATEEQRC